MKATLEQRALKISIFVTLVVSTLGIVFGLLSGSRSVLFDGVFSSIDAAMSGLALVVARLVVREASQRFQHGYWHLEPLVAGLNGSILLLLCFYAFLNAVQGLMSGGNELSFGIAVIYAVVVTAVCAAMAIYQCKLNRQVGSELVRIDMHGWVMATSITAALLLAFAIAWVMEHTAYAHLTPYVDSLLLSLLTLCLLPVPIGIVRRALVDIFLIAPSAVDSEVHMAMEPIMKQPGLLSYTSHVAKSGRGYFIEIHIVTSPDFASHHGVVELDDIREQIAQRISIAPEHCWFTVAFTADTRWV